MSDWTWGKIAELCRNLSVLLVREGTPAEAVPLSPAVEQATDDWIRAYARGGPRVCFPC